MKFPEECLRSCITVCRGFGDSERPAWIVPLLVAVAAAVGFLAGRFDVSTLFRRFQRILSSPVEAKAAFCQISQVLTVEGIKQHLAAQGKAEKCKPSCLRRTTSIEYTGIPTSSEQGKEWKMVSKKHTTTEVKGTALTRVDAKKLKASQGEDSPPQISPQSDSGVSSNSSTGSFKKEKLSPLLVGSKRSTPSSGLSSLETSPVGSTFGRRRGDLDADSLCEHYASDQSISPSTKPKPLFIPRSTTASEAGTPKHSPTTCKNGTSSPALSISSQQRALLSGDDTLPAAAWMCGKDAVAMDPECGFKWLELIEASLEDVYGQDWLKNVHPDDILHCKEVVALAQSVKGPFQMEYRLKVAQDQFRWVLDIGKPRFSTADEEFVGFVGWRVDIHERKTIENNYWKYWLLPHEFLVNWSGDGRYFDNASPAFPCFLGYSIEEFKTTPWVDLVHNDDKASTVEAFQSLKDGKAVVNLVNRYRCKHEKVDGPAYVDSTGKYKWLNWTASDVFAACRDITADKLAQEELQRSKQELQRITDVIPGGVFLYRVSREGEESFPYMSKGALNLFSFRSEADHKDGGHPTKRIFGLNVHPDDWPRLEGEMQQAVISQTALDHDYRVIREGETRWVRVHAVPRVHPTGATEWSGIAWDITEQHQVVDALREARDTAEKAAQAKGKFLAHMSHEIRTPMNAVIGMGALLVETDLTDEQREYATTIRSSGEALLGIINDILDYSKIEAGKMELELQPVDILQVVEESFDLVAPQAALKSLELTYSLSDSVPVVIGDAARIRQILVNLLSNAVKFTDRGSVSVSVDAHRTDDSAKASSKCSLNGAGKQAYRVKRNLWEIQFSVRDSGIGIPDDRKNSLFQVMSLVFELKNQLKIKKKAFTQVDASTTRRYGGTGLGLAICSRLCALHGGRIWLDRDQGEGSTFCFTVAAEEVPRTITHNDDVDIPNLHNKRVLIVAGSSSSTQSMCARLLKSWHMRPVCANSSEEALKLLRQMADSSTIFPSRLALRNEKAPLSFDAVIFDCSLLDAEDPQVMDCLSLCHTELQTVPTLLLVPFGRRTQEYYSGKQPVHFDGYVSKPVKESHLFNAVVNLFAQVEREEHGSFVEYARGPPGAQSRRPSKHAAQPSDGAPSKLSDIGKIYPLRILVAEDNVINQKVMVKLLLRLGYTADVVGNGRDALNSVMSKPYDVCLMDCFMPEMDGLEASRRIREFVRPTPVIVAVTAAALEEEMQACLQAGMHMYVSKPIQADELMHTLSDCWQMKQLESNSSQS